MFTEAIESILKTHCAPATVRAIEGGASAQPLTAAIEEAGFLEFLAPEERGGAGAGWRDFHAVVALFGTWAVPIPLAQTLAARTLITDEPPAGLITYAPVLVRMPDGALHAQQVPGGRMAAHVIGALGDDLVLLRTADAHEVPSGVHGSLSASFLWKTGAGQVLHGPARAVDLQPLAALLHAGLMAGALKRTFDLTMDYANERVQFGKPIGKFQAIQHHLAVMAEHVAAATMAVEAAFSTDSAFPTPSACAVAKARTSEAAQLVASIAHAVHGAIGITEEYDLQLFTRRLHEWRVAHGSEQYWHRELGRLFIACREPLAADFVRTLC